MSHENTLTDVVQEGINRFSRGSHENPLIEAVQEGINRFNRGIHESIHPAFDAYWQDHNIIVKVDLAGFAGDEVEIHLLYNVLNIVAKRKSTEKVLCDAEPEIKMIYSHRPETVVARIVLPFIPPKKDDKTKQPSIADKSTISNGVLTVKIIDIPKLDIKTATG